MPPVALPSQVGHGALGLRDNLRPFAEFMESSATRKVVVAEARPRQVVSGWSNHSGYCWVATLPYPEHDGRAFDVVDLVTGFGGTYTKAESLADCIATEGTFFLDRTTADSGRRWDDGADWWDEAGELWDQVPALLYVHLHGHKVPNETVVQAAVGLYYSNVGQVVPAFGPEKLTNGSLEAWGSATDATGWTEATTAGGTVNRESTTVKSGTYALRLSAAAEASAEVASIRQDRSVRVGKVYRLCGDYLTPEGLSSDLKANLRLGISAATQYVLADGRDYSAGTTGIDLAATNGEWRRFALDFRAWSDSDAFEVRIRLRNSAGAARTGSVYFDNLSLRCIHSFEYAEGRVTEAPEASSGTSDVFFGGRSVGAGTLELAGGTDPDGAGVFEALLGNTEWQAAEVRCFYGGAFPDGQELLFDDYRRVFTGSVQDTTLTDQRLSLSLNDIRSLFYREIPTRIYDPLEFPALEDGAAGKVRPWIFGAVENVRPTRIDITTLAEHGVADYGVYEFMDTNLPDDTACFPSAVWAYESEAVADSKDEAARVVAQYLTPPDTQGRFFISNDARIIRVEAEKNDRINFKVRSGSERTARATAGVYTPRTLALHLEQTAFPSATGAYRIVAATNDRIDAIVNGVAIPISLTAGDYTQDELLAHIQTQANAAGQGGIWSAANGVFTWTSDMGLPTVQVGFRWGTGPNAGRSAGPEIGFGVADTVQTIPLNVSLPFSGNGTYPCSYDEATKKFTLARHVGAFSILASTGTNKDVSLLGDLSFDRTTDKTGAISYTAEESGFTSAAEQHFVRVDLAGPFGGLSDTGGGVYTGTASTRITKAPDILRCVLRGYLGFSDALIDVATSFDAARTLAPQPLGVVLDEPTNLRDFFARLEASSGGSVVIDGDGMIHFEVYTSDVPASTPELFDRDYLSWTTRKLIADVYSEVRVRYGRALNASGGQERNASGQFVSGSTSDGSLVRVATSEEARLRFGAVVAKDFWTYLMTADDAQRRANTFMAMATSPLPVVVTATKSKLVDRKEGDKVRLTRARALTPTGSLDSAVYRIKSIRRRFREGLVEIEAVPDTVTQAT